MEKGSLGTRAEQSRSQVDCVEGPTREAIPQGHANTNVVMEAMNIKITKAKYRSGIAFMLSSTEPVPKKLHRDGLFWPQIQLSHHGNG
jgi:hypothetical protein